MKQLLLIEDNDEIRENTGEILELAGYKVRSAANGKLGVELALEQRPDLIICDIMMPVLDGYGVLHLINRNPLLHGIPFIFLTAKSERGDFRKGMELGADDYISKPFNDTELLNAVESRLKKSDLLKSEYAASPEGMQHLLSAVSGKDAVDHLGDNRSTNKYKKKQVIYSEGNNPSRLYYVESGKVKTFKSNEDGKELTIGLYSEGDFLGYTALLEQSVYKETAEAIEDSELAIISKEEFETLINTSPEAARKFIKLLAKDVTEKEQQLIGLAYNSLRKRVADALVTLQQKFQKDITGNFAIHISREDLANIAGTATESLIRTLGDFKNEKLIEVKDGNIIILNEKKLASMFN